MSAEKKESRINIKDLPEPEKELSAEEQKSVQGGATRIVSPGIRTGGGGTNAPEDTEATSSNLVQGNRIGTDSNGT